MATTAAELDALAQSLRYIINEQLRPNATILERFTQLNEIITLDNGEFIRSLGKFEEDNQTIINQVIENLGFASLVGETASSQLVITDLGQTKLDAATVTNPILIDSMVVGDGNGGFYVIDGSELALVNQVWQGNVSNPIVDVNNPTVLIFDAQVPISEGPWVMREAGLLDSDGDLFAVGLTAAVSKPDPSGNGSVINVRLFVTLDNVSEVDLFIFRIPQEEILEVQDNISNWRQEVQANTEKAESAALAASASANYEGIFVSGITSAVAGNSYSFENSTWLCLADTSTDPQIGDPSWRKVVSADDVKEAEERTLGPGTYLYVGTGVTNGKGHVQNGDVVNPGVTHLTVLINGKPEDVAISPLASGAVNSLTETSAVIGGTPVIFNNVGFKQFAYLYNTDGGLVVDGAVSLGDRFSVENYHQGSVSGKLFSALYLLERVLMTLASILTYR